MAGWWRWALLSPDEVEWHPAGWLVCLPLLIFPCTIKSRSSLVAPAHAGGPRKRAVKRLWCGGGVLNNTESRKTYKIISIDNSLCRIEEHSSKQNSFKLSLEHNSDWLFLEHAAVECSMQKVLHKRSLARRI